MTSTPTATSMCDGDIFNPAATGCNGDGVVDDADNNFRETEFGGLGTPIAATS